MIKAVAELAECREALLSAVGGSSDLALIRSWGNRGDDLIYAGTRSLLRDQAYREYDIRQLDQIPAGTTAIITGGGAWCKPFHVLAEMLPAVESRFSRVIVFPSSFDTEEAIVRKALARTKAVVFAREHGSYERIRHLCDARLAHDSAFFFDFTPYQSGFHAGILSAFRTDAEAAGMPVPVDNRDISVQCGTLDEWLWSISRHELIRTDRAHVAIAGAMLGRTVEYRPSSYHKVPEIVRFSIFSDQVTLIKDTEELGGRELPRPHAVAALSSEQTAHATTNEGCAREPAEEETLYALKNQVECVAQSLRACRTELGGTAMELQEARRSMDALRQSWSWRLTAPLRSLTAVVLLALRLQPRGSNRSKAHAK
jgi:exopolysaccharide biosynthesis predicted pyruvyltransferase EpsI